MALGRDGLEQSLAGGSGWSFCWVSAVQCVGVAVAVERTPLRDRGVPSLVTHRCPHDDQIVVVPRGRRTVTYEKERSRPSRNGSVLQQMTE